MLVLCFGKIGRILILERGDAQTGDTEKMLILKVHLISFLSVKACKDWKLQNKVYYNQQKFSILKIVADNFSKMLVNF